MVDRFRVGSVQRREMLHRPGLAVGTGAQVANGRLTARQAEAVWSEAGRVAAALDRGDCWWLPRWADWCPPGGQAGR